MAKLRQMDGHDLRGFLQSQENGETDQELWVANEDLERFAEYVSYAEVIPYEQSPQQNHSIATFMSSVLPVSTAGVPTAFLAMYYHQPILFITAPIGILLCGTAQSIVKALNSNEPTLMSKIIRKWIKV